MKTTARTSFTALLLSGLTGLALTACGGGNQDASVGGSVNGLTSGTTVTLQNNATDNLTIGSNQQFTFSKQIAAGNAYSVTVLTQPVGELCSVGNASGTIDNAGDAVTNVTVSCAFSSSVGGTVTGLATNNSVILSTNGVSMTVASNGVFAFPGIYAAGSAYNVVVASQPSGQTCTVTNGSGTVATNTLATVTVACV